MHFTPQDTLPPGQVASPRSGRRLGVDFTPQDTLPPGRVASPRSDGRLGVNFKPKILFRPGKSSRPGLASAWAWISRAKILFPSGVSPRLRRAKTQAHQAGTGVREYIRSPGRQKLEAHVSFFVVLFLNGGECMLCCVTLSILLCSLICMKRVVVI